MIRQTGGTAVGEISTRSSPFCLAMASAAGGGMIPSCCPVSSITRTSRTRIRSFVRTRSSRRGERSKAIYPPRPSGRLIHVLGRRAQSLSADLVDRISDERLHRTRPQHAGRSAPDVDGAVGSLAIPDDEHVWDLLELRLPDLIANLLRT